MECSVVGVPKFVREMWHVFLFDDGTLHAVGSPHTTRLDAEHYAWRRHQKQPDCVFMVRRALVLLN